MPAEQQPKTHWWKVGIASAILAILIKAVLPISFTTMFISILVIYSIHVVWGQIGSQITTVWGWIKSTRHAAAGVVIFLALRYIIAQVIGLYPIDTYHSLDSGGILKGILPGRDVPKTIMFESLFALVAGGITVAWAQEGKYRWFINGVLGFSLLVVILQITCPKYVAKWPNWDRISANLDENGFGGTMMKGTKYIIAGRPAPKPTPAQTAAAITTKATVLRFDGFTPCKPPIDFVFELDTQGDPISLKFPSVPAPLEYCGKGTINAPTNRTSGAVFITSLDPAKQARVRIWEVVTVPMVR
jgi:hypothetical protein